MDANCMKEVRCKKVGESRLRIMKTKWKVSEARENGCGCEGRTGMDGERGVLIREWGPDKGA